jgi:predicted phage tail protein
VVTAVWLEWWPLLVTCAVAFAAGLWTRWALGDTLSAALLAIPASMGVGGIVSVIATAHTCPRYRRHWWGRRTR